MNTTGHFAAFFLLPVLWTWTAESARAPTLDGNDGEATSALNSTRKCATRSDSTSGPVIPLVAVDGDIKGPAQNLDGESLLSEYVGVPPEDIHSITVECFNPRDSTFGGPTGISVISVWTKDGPIAQVKSALTAIQSAQHAHFRDHASYRTELDGIELPDLPTGVSLTLEATDTGWNATAMFVGKLMRCTIFEGTSNLTGNPGEAVCKLL